MENVELYIYSKAAHWSGGDFISQEDLEGYIKHCSLDFYAIPSSINDDERDKIFDGEADGTLLGNITGQLILGSQAAKTGVDIYDVCDAKSGDLEAVASALNLDNTSRASHRDIFYIESVALENGCDTDIVRDAILKQLPCSLLSHYSIFPDILTYCMMSFPRKSEEAEKYSTEEWFVLSAGFKKRGNSGVLTKKVKMKLTENDS